MSNDLWAGLRLPIIMVSGPVNSGKTLFGLTIDPNCRKPASEVQPTTLVYDQEGSAEPYADGLNFEWRDTRAAVAAGVHREVLSPDTTNDPRWLQILKKQADCNDSPSAAMFRAWYLSLLKVPAGRYAVGVCDTFTPLQDGMVDWLRRHPEAFGRTFNEYQKASSMTLWPDAKAMLSHILTVDCRLRFQTFVMNVHLKNEWNGGSKTGKQVAEGLDVLEKLATLHLEFDRSPTAKGKEAPRVPAAIVKKERLVRFAADGNDQPILPPRIPACTPDAIRKYIASPPDFAKLEAGERLPDQSMSEDDKLRLQASIAENHRAAEESKLSALELARQAMQHGRMTTTTALMTEQTIPQATDAAATGSDTAIANQEMVDLIVAELRRVFTSGDAATRWLTAQHGVSHPQNLLADAAANCLATLRGMSPAQPQQQSPQSQPSPESAPTASRITEQQANEMLTAMKQLFPNGQAAMEWLQLTYQTSDPGCLTESQATDALVYLTARLADKKLSDIQTPAPSENTLNGPATPKQREEIKSLTTHVYGDQAPDAQNAFLQSLGLGSPSSLTYSQAQARIEQLKADPRAANYVPF
jgi:hypothetical protein